MLEEDRVAHREVRGCETRHLVVGEVPRHDPQEHPQRRAADNGGALAQDVDRLVARDPLGVVGVVLRDVGGEVHLPQGRGQGLAHLPHDDRRELVPPLAVELGGPADSRRPLGHGDLAPGAVRRRRGGDRRLQLRVGRRRIGGEGLSCHGVHDRVVAHGCSSDQWVVSGLGGNAVDVRFGSLAVI